MSTIPRGDLRRRSGFTGTRDIEWLWNLKRPDLRSASGGRLAIAFLLAAATILIRLPNFGDPTYHIDEAFYLFVGQKMNEGLLPYVDLWDRKPAGLFYLFAVIAYLGDVWAYQAIAALFAWVTALILAFMATRFAGRVAACAVGVFYLAMLGALAGGGGQSPVFYNLFVASAASLVMRQWLSGRSGRLSLSGDGAMLLCGLALTIKPTALAEGAFFGLALLAVHWQTHRDARQLAIYGARLGAAALAPTIAIWAHFYAAGHLELYWYATMQSIFLTQPPSPSASTVRLLWLGSILWAPALMAVAGLVMLARRTDRLASQHLPSAVFISGWLAAAVTGFLLVPNFYDHYALPLTGVFALASAPLFDRRNTGPILAVLACAYVLAISGFPGGQIERRTASQAGFTAATDIISRHAAGRCIFVYDATPALYRPFAPCLANRYAFPEHLSNQREASAIGADPVKILLGILDQDPGVIVIPESPSVSTPNLATRSILRRHLAQRYERVGEASLVDVVGTQEVEIWALLK